VALLTFGIPAFDSRSEDKITLLERESSGRMYLINKLASSLPSIMSTTKEQKGCLTTKRWWRERMFAVSRGSKFKDKLLVML